MILEARARLRDHLLPLFALFLLHCAVFARSLVPGASGHLEWVIPWDFQDSYHRFLCYDGDALHQGLLPLWYPYGAAGVPFFAQPQNQLWSPVTLLLGTLFGYSHDLAQRQAIFTLFLAATGAYALGTVLWRSRTAGLFAGLCYGLTPALYAGLEHGAIVTALALAPWLFFAFERATAGRRWGFPLLAFLLYWLITAGYPGVVAMILLWLSAAAAWFVLQRPRQERLGLVLRGAAAALVGVGLAAVLWLPVLAHRTEFTRGSALGVEQALSGSLTFAHLWSIFLPFLTSTGVGGGDPDISMRGLYLGALALPLAALAVLRAEDKVLRPLCALALIALLMSCGGSFFPRIALHLVLPALNFSRFPSADSRALFALAVALLAGGGARLLAQGDRSSRALVARGSGALLVVLAFGLIAFRVISFANVEPAEYLRRAVAPVSLEMLCLFVALLALWRAPRPELLLRLFWVLLALDLGSAVLANYAPVGRPATQVEIEEREALRERGYPAAAAEVPRLLGPKGVDDPAAAQGYTSKRFFLGDYGGFRLRRFQHLLAAGFLPFLERGPRAILLSSEAHPASLVELSAQAQPVELRIEQYLPDRVDYQLRVPQAGLLVLNEVYFPGWKATVDGHEAEVVEVAGGLRGLQIGEGAHQLVTRFSPRIFYVALAISLVSVALLLLWGWSLRAGGWRPTTVRAGPRG